MANDSASTRWRLSVQQAVFAATTYFGVSFLAWLLTCFRSGPADAAGQALSPGGDVVVALLLGTIGLLIRRWGRPLQKPTRDRNFQDGPSVQTLWRNATQTELTVTGLSLAATVNWIGCFILVSLSLWDALPAIFTLLAFEVGIATSQLATGPSLLRMLHDSVLKSVLVRLLAFSTVTEVDANARPTNESEAERPLRTLNESAEEALEFEEPHDVDAEIQRVTRFGVDAAGQKYHTGQVFCPLDSGQRTAEVILGFSPPFVGDPDIEFESSDPDCRVTLGRISPQGAQLLIRRSDADHALDLELDWYASSSHASAEVRKILP